ncbi:MAG TPA: PrpR N-terminal domain-containing protein [Candidatus Enterocloster excrementigallinarum]|mgnify:FL=1|uniref:PrpR N-terminal domain-containing protein n=1 Tax=Candidatus Enterocloster excrementigallinarum TaxID=2838558 RepID=A0A9D2TD39_9FIRM|nr:PrpR N-terminal domain-containing protein [Candidatus Enterocloster excrementigallinarum]
MGKIVLLVSREEMLYQVHNILQEKKYKIDEMRVIRTEDTVIEARKAVAEGATLIIARGLQASLIKQYIDVPVAEIVMTAQEMGLLVLKAKQILKMERPVIAVVGFKNMFCDMSFFDQLYGVELRIYLAQTGDELEQEAEHAVEDNADLLIGGDTVVNIATKYKKPSLFLSPTEDSMRNALAVAERMNYAMEAEKQKEAQLEAFLDNSPNGVLRTDVDGKITTVNPVMEELLGNIGDQIEGRTLFQIFPDIDSKIIQALTENKRENYTLFLQVGKNPVFAVLAPVMIEGAVNGFILTCSRIQPKRNIERREKSSQVSGGMIAHGKLSDLIQKSSKMQSCVQKAYLYAMSERPVLIEGEAGTEIALMAQAIHNSSSRSQGPFGMICCRGQNDEQQENTIFSASGILASVTGGTLLIEGIEEMTRQNQQKLAGLIQYKRCAARGELKKIFLDVRVIAAAGAGLEEKLEKGEFLPELYFQLKGLTIQLPPLRERKEDLKEKLTQCIKKNCEFYGRYHVLTEGAFEILMDYEWPGNLIQVEAFCDYLILTAKKRSIDQIQVKEALRGLFGNLKSGPDGETRTKGSYLDSQEQKIRDALKKNGGRREETARFLGISKSTLWRYMKKYEIL